MFDNLLFNRLDNKTHIRAILVRPIVLEPEELYVEIYLGLSFFVLASSLAHLTAGFYEF